MQHWAKTLLAVIVVAIFLAAILAIPFIIFKLNENMSTLPLYSASRERAKLAALSQENFQEFRSAAEKQDRKRLQEINRLADFKPGADKAMIINMARGKEYMTGLDELYGSSMDELRGELIRDIA